MYPCMCTVFLVKNEHIVCSSLWKLLTTLWPIWSISLQVIEHVADPAEFCKSLSALTVSEGATVISTINRSMRAYATAIIAAEYILHWVLFCCSFRGICWFAFRGISHIIEYSLPLDFSITWDDSSRNILNCSYISSCKFTLIKTQPLVVIWFFSIEVIQAYYWLYLNFHLIIDKMDYS